MKIIVSKKEFAEVVIKCSEISCDGCILSKKCNEGDMNDLVKMCEVTEGEHDERYL